MNSTPETHAVATGTTAIAAVDPARLTAVGLTDADLPMVAEIKGTIGRTFTSIADFGRDVGVHTAAYADGLLEQVRSSDLSEAGKQLNAVLGAAKAFNLSGLSRERSRVPLIGKWIDKVRLTKDQVMAQFGTAREQVDALLTEVEKTTTRIAERNTELDDMFAAVQAEYHLTGAHIVAAQLTADEWKQDLAAMPDTSSSPAGVQAAADLQTQVDKLEKRIADLRVVQYSALQSLPMIRMIQANYGLLEEKFHTVRQITVPSWKRSFMLGLSLNEQQNAVALADAIDEATNAIQVRNAQLLHTNSVSAAKANQRLVIDVSTLQTVNKELIATLEDVIQVQRDGAANRQKLEGDLTTMRRELENRLARRADQSAA